MSDTNRVSASDGGQVRQVSSLKDDPGFFDKDEDRVEPGPDPFVRDRALTTCPE